MAVWAIGRLSSTHDRAAFDCGQPSLNDWLRDRAGQFDRRDLSRTYLATRPQFHNICGYYALSTHRVRHEVLSRDDSKGLPQMDVPVVLLGRLAVDCSCQGQGLGALLLVDALRRTAQISDQVGVRAMEVDAIDDDAKKFYVKFGFRPLRDDPRHLYMPMHEIRKLKLPKVQ